jgi:hypothetical protein
MKEPNVILKYAVEEIVHKINKEKMSPHDAVVKVAKELDLNPNFIKRATEVVNVALTYNHFKKNAESKDQDFPIVDSYKVAEEIFGHEDKTAAELRSEWFPSTDFEAEQINHNKILNNPKYKKAYLEITNTSDNYDSYAMSFRGIFEKSAEYLDRLEKDLDDLRSKSAGANYDYNRTFSTIIEKFARDINYRTTFGEFESQVYSMYGERAVPYLDLLYKTSGVNDARGVHDDKYQLFNTCKEAELFVQFMKKSEEYNQLSKSAGDAEHNLKFEKEYLQQAYHKLGQARLAANHVSNSVVQNDPINLPEVKELPAIQGDPVLEASKKKINPENEVLDESVLTEGQKRLPHKLKRAIIHSKKKLAEDSIKEAAFGFGDAYKVLQQRAQQESSPSSSIPMTSPQDNMERKLMLQELISSDPHLAHADPRRIGELYQQVLRIAPELSKEKEVMRSQLRTMSEGQGLSPYDTHQLIQTNKDFIDQRKSQEGIMKQPKS